MGIIFNYWQNLLSLEMENDNYQNVIDYADEALTYFPNQPVLYLYAGSAHFSLKNFKNAIMFWEQGKSIVYGNDKMKSSFAAQLADAYHADKQYEKAFETYEEAIKANPSNYFAINNYAYYLSLKKKNLDRAKQLSSRMVKDNPDNATFFRYPRLGFISKGRISRSLKVFGKSSGKSIFCYYS